MWYVERSAVDAVPFNLLDDDDLLLLLLFLDEPELLISFTLSIVNAQLKETNLW